MLSQCSQWYILYSCQIHSFLCKGALSVHIYKIKINFFPTIIFTQAKNIHMRCELIIRFKSKTPCALQKPPSAFFPPPEHRVIHQNTMHLQYAYRLVLGRKMGT